MYSPTVVRTFSTKRIAADLLRALAAAVPYRTHAVLTDNGTHFTEPTGDGRTPGDIRPMSARNEPFLCHAFELACAELGVEQRLTKPRHPCTNGQVERMSRTVKDATVKRFSYESHGRWCQHLADFVAAYNFARRLTTLRGLNPLRSHLQSLDGRHLQLHP
jgi:transposase InsO family protein